jgi:Uncharacterized conserved protein
MNPITEYINERPLESQTKLKEMYQIIKEVVTPETTEKISWAMPTFYLYGNLVHFAYAKNHVGFYPGENGVANFLDRLTEYKTSKGAIQFSYTKPLPKNLIQDIVKFRIKENIANKK